MRVWSCCVFIMIAGFIFMFSTVFTLSFSFRPLLRLGLFTASLLQSFS